MNTENRDPSTDLLLMLSYARPAYSEAEAEFRERFLLNLPNAVVDEHKNIVIVVGEGSKTLFSCHTDTVHAKGGRQDVLFDPSLGVAWKEDKQPLGADDGAGCWIMREMILAGVPGTYIFHACEERGGVGSAGRARTHAEWLSQFSRAVAFDRRGTGDVITHQAGGRCCSLDFAVALSARLSLCGLDYSPCERGVFTDTANYTDIIPECTNLSVGYEDEHRPSETLDVNHLNALLNACMVINWEDLVTSRDPKVMDPDDYERYYGRYSGYGSLSWDDSGQKGRRYSSADLSEQSAELALEYGFDAEMLARDLLQAEDRVSELEALVYDLDDEIAQLKQRLADAENRARAAGNVIPLPGKRRRRRRKAKAGAQAAERSARDEHEALATEWYSHLMPEPQPTEQAVLLRPKSPIPAVDLELDGFPF